MVGCCGSSLVFVGVLPKINGMVNEFFCGVNGEPMNEPKFGGM